LFSSVDRKRFVFSCFDIMSPTVYLLIGIVVLAFVLMSSRERFRPEFLDTAQVKRTVATEDSHYTQTTNHMNPAKASFGSVSGMPTPFQVNQYTAYLQ
jgi:hypothetical protein